MGEVGFRAVSLLLRLGERVAVVDRTPRDAWVRELEAAGVQVVRGDARDLEVLQAAGIERAKALLALTDQDMVNVQCALEADQRYTSLPTIVRVFDQDLAVQLERSLNLRRAASMPALVAPSFAAAAIGGHTLGALAVGQERFVLERMLVDAAAVATYHTLGGLVGEMSPVAVAYESADGAFSPVLDPHRRLREGDGLLVLRRVLANVVRASAPRSRWHPHTWLAGVRSTVGFLGELWGEAPTPLRVALGLLIGLIAMSVFIFSAGLGLSLIDAFYYVISTVTTTGYGDITPREHGPSMQIYATVVMLLGSVTMAVFYSIVTDFIVRSRFEWILSRSKVPESDHVVVVGIGAVGYRVAHLLHDAGVPTVAVERDTANDFVAALQAEIPVVVGDARLEETLLRAGVPRAAAVVAVSADATVNLSVGLSTRTLNPHARTVLRMADADLAQKVGGVFGVDAVLSSSLIAAPTFVAAALFEGTVRAFVVSDTLLAFVRYRVGADDAGASVADFGERHGVTPLLRRGPQDPEFEKVGEAGQLVLGEEVLATLCRPLA